MIAVDEADALERLKAANASGPFRCAACCLEPTCRLACSRSLCLSCGTYTVHLDSTTAPSPLQLWSLQWLALTKGSIHYDLVGQRKAVLVDWWTLWLWTTTAKCSPWSSRASARRPFSCQVRDIIAAILKHFACTGQRHPYRVLYISSAPAVCRHTAGQGWEAGRAAGGEAGQVWPPPVLVCQAYW